MAEVLAQRGLDVTLVELSPQVLPPMDFDMAQIVHAHLADNGVGLRLGVSVTGFDAAGAAAAGGRGVALRLSDGSSLASDLTLLAVGLQLGARGAIVTNAHMQTSDPAVYAVGDAVTTGDGVLGPDAPPLWVPLAGPANRQAHVVADHICGRPTGATYNGALGTSIVKVFKLAAGGTGLSEKAAARAGRPVRVVHVHPNSHAGAYSGGLGGRVVVRVVCCSFTGARRRALPCPRALCHPPLPIPPPPPRARRLLPRRGCHRAEAGV
jgi:NADPH-dependent 2,4-dienoyl-CoA reductase/sulfur reductase-like enzyme